MYSPDHFASALAFAATRHLGQIVPGTELPYIVHVTTVAAEVIEAISAEPVANSELAVLCALLHDTIEDTATTHRELVTTFGVAIADGVQALSKSAVLPKELQMADSLRRIRLQPLEVWIVKLADRIANLKSAPTKWSQDKRRAYRDEAVVIADELGSASPVLHMRLRSRIENYPVG